MLYRIIEVLENKSLTKSELDDIQGIGEKRKKALLNHFKDIEAIKNATFEELLEVESMNKSSSESVMNILERESEIKHEFK